MAWTAPLQVLPCLLLALLHALDPDPLVVDVAAPNVTAHDHAVVDVERLIGHRLPEELVRRVGHAPHTGRRRGGRR
eukprot:12909487-Heterocapsa_arctica.AAC.1